MGGIMRKGMGKGFGSGYYNIAPKDSYVHSLSAKGIKTQSVLKRYTPSGKMMLFNRIDEKKGKTSAKSKLYRCSNCGQDYYEDEVVCPNCRMTSILDAKGRNVKYKMSKEEKEMLAKETPYLKILRNTFKKMSNKENWKMPPKPFVTKSYPLALQVENTFNHFLGGSEMTALPNGEYQVTSKGYYHYIDA